MQHDPRFQRIGFDARPPGLIARSLAVIAATGLAVLTFMFSLVVFSVVLVVGLGVAAWFWWRTRELRRRMREARAAMDAQMNMGDPRGPHSPRPSSQRHGEGLVIEGDFIREVPEQSDTTARKP